MKSAGENNGMKRRHRVVEPHEFDGSRHDRTGFGKAKMVEGSL